MKNDELTVRTPLGELVVGIKADPDYPGISVAFCGNGMNDCFNEGSIRLAWIEYSPEKRRLQAIVYGDGNADDYQVDVPLRTQGWINDKLISVTIENGKCEHLRYMRSKGAQCSQKIFDCMHELILKACSETEE